MSAAAASSSPLLDCSICSEPFESDAPIAGQEASSSSSAAAAASSASTAPGESSVDHRPRVLPCGHTFCSSCLQAMVEHSRGVLRCPTCRCDVPAKTLRDGIAGLPFNFILIQTLPSRKEREDHEKEVRMQQSSQLLQPSSAQQQLRGLTKNQKRRLKKKRDLAERAAAAPVASGSSNAHSAAAPSPPVNAQRDISPVLPSASAAAGVHPDIPPPPAIGFFAGPPVLSHESKAEELVWEAWDQPVGSVQRRRLVALALETCADLPIALYTKAEEFPNPAEQLPYLQRAVSAAAQRLGVNYFQQAVGSFWGMPETRPYMHSKNKLAFVFWKLGRADEAIAAWKECLRLCNSDNLGVRDVLTSVLLERGDLDDAEAIVRKFALQDCPIGMGFANVLLLFKRAMTAAAPQGGAAAGDSPRQALLHRALAELRKAVSNNVHVVDYLTGAKQMPQQLPECVTCGEASEAAEYARWALAAWQHSPGALDWLRANAPALVAASRAEQAVREQQQARNRAQMGRF